jgi:hydrogenase nickel incorporation protein HypB
MCGICGCDSGTDHQHPHPHPHPHPHSHRDVEARPSRTLRLEAELLAANDRQAAENRERLERAGTLALNLIGAPGAGKTALLERTVRALAPELEVRVIEGDQETDHDARRILAAGAKVVQINTGAGCHLDARQVRGALDALGPPAHTLLAIENVGNLVCPALFDLGERMKVVVSAVTEGEDKPLKYPQAFRAASALVLTKVDLLPHLVFDADLAIAHARSVNPALRIFRVSARTGAGLDRWVGFIREALLGSKEHARWP